VTRGRLGLRLQELTPELANAFRVPHGALVTDAERGGPAREAGIRSGDVVVSFNGAMVTGHEALLRLIEKTPPGTMVDVELVRDGAPMQRRVRVAEADPPRPRTAPASGADRFGLRLAPLEGTLRRRLAPEGGVLVERASGTARLAGLHPGDVILGVNGGATRNPDALRAALEQARPGEAVALLVLRGGRRTFVPLRIP
jgi:serine protease Do